MADRILDMSVVLKGAENAQRKLKDIEKSGEKAGNKTEMAFAKAAIGITALVAAGAKVANMFSTAIKLATEQTDAVTRLNAALEAHGQFTEAGSQAIQNYASALQLTLGVGDEVLINVAAQVQALTGLGADTMPRVIDAAIQLAEVTGLDLVSASKMLAKQLTGDTDVLTRYIGATKVAGDANASLTAILEKTSAGMDIAIARTQTFEGANRLLTNAWGDLLEEIGFFITKNPEVIGAFRATADALATITGHLSDTTSEFESMSQKSAAEVQTMSDSIVKAFANVEIVITQIVNSIQVSFNLIQLGLLEIMLGLRKAANAILSFFGQLGDEAIAFERQWATMVDNTKIKLGELGEAMHMAEVRYASLTSKLGGGVNPDFLKPAGRGKAFMEMNAPDPVANRISSIRSGARSAGRAVEDLEVKSIKLFNAWRNEIGGMVDNTFNKMTNEFGQFVETLTDPHVFSDLFDEVAVSWGNAMASIEQRTADAATLIAGQIQGLATQLNNFDTLLTPATLQDELRSNNIAELVSGMTPGEASPRMQVDNAAMNEFIRMGLSPEAARMNARGMQDMDCSGGT